MSTTFGIPLYSIDDSILVDEDGCLQPYISENFFNDIFFRGNNGSNNRWLNNWAENLDENTKVYALDNTPQGIYTIKDIKEFLNKTK
jgi:hypothetical protein